MTSCMSVGVVEVDVDGVSTFDCVQISIWRWHSFRQSCGEKVIISTGVSSAPVTQTNIRKHKCLEDNGHLMSGGLERTRSSANHYRPTSLSLSPPTHDPAPPRRLPQREGGRVGGGGKRRRDELRGAYEEEWKKGKNENTKKGMQE